MMNAKLRSVLVFFLFMLHFGRALADDYTATINLFRDAGESREFFNKSYGYAVFPFIGKGAYVVGGAYGKGQVYRGGTHVGDSTMSQLTVGFQAGGQAYSQIIFFENQRAFDEFTSGNFQMSVQATAVAATAAAGVQAGTIGQSMNASGTQNHAVNAAKYNKGMAVFTITKGGLMYEASVGGQMFEYTQKGERVTRRSPTAWEVEGANMP